MTCFFTGSAAAVTFDAAKKLDISSAHVSVLLQRSSGRFAGSTSVAPCREYGWCASKTRGYMTTR